MMPIRETNEASNKFLRCFFTEAKGDRIASHELWEEYVLGTGKNNNADQHWSADRRLATSDLSLIRRSRVSAQQGFFLSIGNMQLCMP